MAQKNNKFLIDTHIFLWWISDDKRLPRNALKAIKNPDNIIFVSIVSLWEINLKKSLNNDFLFNTNLKDLLSEENFELLPITTDHVENISILEQIHKDPFDRMIISQAITDELTLITEDELIKKYTKVKIL